MSKLRSIATHRVSRTAATMLATALAGPAAQGPTLVEGGGDALQRAIDRAAPGEILEVRAARYDACSVSIGVTILADPGVVLDGGPDTALTVEDLPSGQAFEARGLEILTTDAFPQGEPSLVVQRCAGVVALEATRIRIRRPGVFLTGGQVRFSSSTGPVACTDLAVVGALGPEEYRVLIEDCSSVALFDSPSLPPIDALRSNLELASSNVPAVIRTGSVRATDCTVSITDCTIEGSAGSISAPNLFPAVSLQGGELAIAGTSMLTGARLFGVPGPALAARTGTVRLGDGVVLSSDAPDPIVGDATVVRAPIPDVFATISAASRRIRIEVNARPGDRIATILEVQGSPTNTPFGPLWVVLTAPVIDSGVVPGSGQRRFSIPLPTVPRPVPVTVQPIALTRDDELVLGTARPLLIR